VPWQAPHGFEDVANAGDRNKKTATTAVNASSMNEALCALKTDTFVLVLSSAIFHQK
jgi:hypothetical protein